MGYNVISSQFYRYARVCSFKKDFMENCNITINILKRNGFKDIILRKFIKKFFNKNNWVWVKYNSDNIIKYLNVDEM